MFNYNADQIFVIHPHGTGGGILSFILSLDNQSATLDFKNKKIDKKLYDWRNFCKTNDKTAHLYKFINIGSFSHTENIKNADHCARYIHKGHFYNLDEINVNKKLTLLNEFSKPVKSIGIYITDYCIEKLVKIRNNKISEYNFYSKWIYSNQVQLQEDFFNIQCMHTFSFSDLLDKNLALDHIDYCKHQLDLNFDNKIAESVIDDWYSKILHAR